MPNQARLAARVYPKLVEAAEPNDNLFISPLSLSEGLSNNTYINMTLSQIAPILPFLFLVLMLIFRPRGLLGTREG